MIKVAYIVAVLLVVGVRAWGGLIASESFATTENPEDYQHEVPFPDPPNSSVLVGTTGFSADTPWRHRTMAIRPRDFGALNHRLLAGDAVPGIVVVQGTSDRRERNSIRELAEQPEGDTFYMSGLVQVPTPRHLNINDKMAMGLTGFMPFNMWDVSRGIHIGVHKDDSDYVYLSAFAGGNTYKLSDAFTAREFNAIHLVVLRVDLGSGPDGEDTLNAWIAHPWDRELTHVLEVSDIDVGTAEHLRTFVIQGAGGGDSTSAGARFDEFRFGKSLSDVVTE